MSLVFLTSAALMYKAQGFTDLVLVLTTVCCTLVILWNILFLIEVIMGITNELRN